MARKEVKLEYKSFKMGLKHFESCTEVERQSKSDQVLKKVTVKTIVLHLLVPHLSWDKKNKLKRVE